MASIPIGTARIMPPIPEIRKPRYRNTRVSSGGMILAVPIGMLAMNLYEFGAFDSLIDNLKILVHDINEFRKKE